MSIAKDLIGQLSEQRSNWYENVKTEYLGQVQIENFFSKGRVPTISTFATGQNSIFPDPDDYYRLMIEHITLAAEFLQNEPNWKNGSFPEKIEYFKSRGDSQVASVRLLIGRYALLYAYSYELSNKWKKLADVDRSEKVRNVVFRFIQTIAVGFAFVLVLEVAHWFKIPLIIFTKQI